MRRIFGTRPQFLALVLSSVAASCAHPESSEPASLPMEPAVVVAQSAPPAISGGTLIVARDGHTAVAADPDRDRVWIVELTTGTLLSEVVLNPHDEPGRVIEDNAGRVHVALRNAASIATIDLATGAIVARTRVCVEPRGLAFDENASAIHVACESGDLVTIGLDGKEIRRLHLERDLRDVVVQGTHLWVSRFRSAELMAIDATGTLVETIPPPQIASMTGTFTPSVAWRMVPLADGGVIMAHQRGLADRIKTAAPGGYGADSCGGIVHSTVTVFRPGNTEGSPIWNNFDDPIESVFGGTLPVDVAVSPAGSFALAMAGTDTVAVGNLGGVAVNCGLDPHEKVSGQPTAVAFDAGGRVIVQTREPPQLLVLDSNTVIPLPGVSMFDTGHEMFHRPPASQTALIACASCHPEGREDGRVWHFDPTGQDDVGLGQPRRTQDLGGHVLDTAPLHWNGDMKNLDDIMGEVFVKRMGGTMPGDRHIGAFGDWIQSIRLTAPSTTSAPDAIARGKAIFERADTACTSCHSGDHMTNNATLDVGTGDLGPEAFQVPALVGVGSRAPYLHNGTAATLRDRFNPNIGGGETHGHTAQLSSDQIDDLVSYLDSL